MCHKSWKIGQCDCLSIATVRHFIKYVISVCKGWGANIVAKLYHPWRGVNVVQNGTRIDNDQEIVLNEHVLELGLLCIQWHVDLIVTMY
jgi:hypothetical protein